jgi:hypothetical protein
MLIPDWDYESRLLQLAIYINVHLISISLNVFFLTYVVIFGLYIPASTE